MNPMRCYAAAPVETDAVLLDRYRAGDESALGMLYERYEGPVFRLLFGMLKDRHLAEDALQETFVQAVRKADAVHCESFRGWLFTVAHQQAVLLKRKGKRVPVGMGIPGLLGFPDRGDAPDAEVIRGSEAAIALALLAELPDAQQAVIRLRIFDDLRFKDVAERLGCPINTALARMHDGLAKLRLKWEQRHA
ncbi:MAG: sigma-70 family RNA polymerase sigma factor [Gemmataceae bacterium]